MKALLNVNDDLVREIIEKRPYSSLKDFYQRVKPKKQAMVSLIKAGAFDNMMDRKIAMAWFIWQTCDKKSRLTLQNMPTLIKRKMLVTETEEQILAYKVYSFNQYLKSSCRGATKEYYVLDTNAINFLMSLDLESLINGNIVNAKAWDKVYQKYMDIFRAWLRENSTEILQNLNDQIFQEDWKKYAKRGNLAAWEMETSCFYSHPHELANVNMSKYGLSNFKDLPEQPEIVWQGQKGNRIITLYKLSHICGTCIAKNKTKHIITLLTTDGVVNVKLRKDHYALFDKRISEMGDDGSKHIVEKSWFDRGNMLIIQGIRSGDDFIAKKYASSGGHQLYHIVEVKEDGDLILQTERYKGEGEEW